MIGKNIVDGVIELVRHLSPERFLGTAQADNGKQKKRTENFHFHRKIFKLALGPMKTRMDNKPQIARAFYPKKKIIQNHQIKTNFVRFVASFKALLNLIFFANPQMSYTRKE